MEPMITKTIITESGVKDISVYHTDVCALQQNIDVLVLSAFKCNYYPLHGTVIGAISEKFGISVDQLSKQPEIDLRSCGGVWISKQPEAASPFRRIACVEFKDLSRFYTDSQIENNVFSSVKTLFQALTIAAINGISIDTVAIPALGSNCQKIDLMLMMPPLLNECCNFLNQCAEVKHIIFYEYSASKAYKMAKSLENCYSLTDLWGSKAESPENPDAFYKESPFNADNPNTDSDDRASCFISYSSKDFDIMLEVNEMLEKKGIRTWYAPRNIIMNSYAASIMRGIRYTDYFLIILSANSMVSYHVLNELDAAAKKPGCESTLIPVMLGTSELNDSCAYYLNRVERYQLGKYPNNSNLSLLEQLIPALTRGMRDRNM